MWIKNIDLDKGQAILIGDTVVHVFKVGERIVRIGVEADRSIPITVRTPQPPKPVED